jgi:hypothetical protein
MIPHADTCTCSDCIRIAAFGAIRRTAEWARKCDKWAADREGIDHEVMRVAIHKQTAQTIRATIRLAIESEKD